MRGMFSLPYTKSSLIVCVCQVKISAWGCWVYCGLCSYYATFTLITLLFHFVKGTVPWQQVTLFSLVTVHFFFQSTWGQCLVYYINLHWFYGKSC